MNTDNIKKELNVIPMVETVLFHGSETDIKINSHFDNELYYKIVQDNFYAVALTLRSESDVNRYSMNDFHLVGNIVKIESAQKVTGGFHLKLKVIDRVMANDVWFESGYYKTTYEKQPDIVDMDHKNQKDILEYVKDITEEISQNFKGAESYVEYIKQIDDINKIIAAIIPFVNISVDQKQAFMEMRSLRKRSLRFLDLLIEHKQSIQFQIELNQKFSERANKNYREQMLREQMRAIKEELGESEGSSSKEKKDYRALIEEAGMPEEVKEIALDEVEKFERQSPNSSEINVIRNYLDLLTSLPWGESEIKDIDISQARRKLNEAHYGLDKVKDRIIQHLTVMKLKKNKQGSILLLVGPPGTGKTSLGKSIAQALEREYVRISLGGVRDEAEVRGHRRTYIGAMPGRIIQGMKRVGSKNPVFILDEVDKLMASASGDPASALLEVLDPEQNDTFTDHYLDVPYDLSDVFFIATANSLRSIPGPLRDRMEIIEVGSYTSLEKFHIAKDHLLHEVLEDHGMTHDQLTIEDDALRQIIEKYTREAGVRSLKRQLAKVARVSSEKIVTGAVDLPYTIKESMLRDILGHEIARYDRVGEINPPGVVTGLAWTPVGGDILFIEAAHMPGKGQLILTGQLGDVMKESARISQSLIRSRLALYMKHFDMDKEDIHIHVPAGATPKDGPSAGVAMFTTLASLVTGHPIDPKLAMTGEISLRGAVMPVGGIKEKVIAAHRSGIQRILLPKDNEKDLDDVPQEVKNDVTFIFLESVEDIIRETIGINLPKQEIVDMTQSIDQSPWKNE